MTALMAIWIRPTLMLLLRLIPIAIKVLTPIQGSIHIDTSAPAPPNGITLHNSATNTGKLSHLFQENLKIFTQEEKAGHCMILVADSKFWPEE